MSKGNLFSPKSIRIIDLEEDFPGLSDYGNQCSGALVLVRLHRMPLGMIEIDIPPQGLTAWELKQIIKEQLNSQIEEHLLSHSQSTEDVDHLTGDNHNLPLCSSNIPFYLRDAPRVSIVIATRDRVESLRSCIASILTLDYPDFEIIIVDNAPSDNQTQDYYSKDLAHYPQIKYMREDLPGLAIAHNRGLTEVSSPLVAFTDDDVIVDKYWLKFIAANFLADGEISCVTGMILPYEIKTQAQLWIEQFGGFGKGMRRVAFDLKENRPDDFLFPYAAGRFGSGANMAFRTSVLKAFGGFDPALGAGTIAKGADDLAIFFEIITRGHRLVYEPGALVFHKHREDYDALTRQAYGYGVGLSAFLTRALVEKPARIFELGMKLPSGLCYLLNPRSGKNKKKEKGYPKELSRLELYGIASGPYLYLSSRRHLKKVRDALPRI